MKAISCYLTLISIVVAQSSSINADSCGMLDSDHVVSGCIQPYSFLPRFLPKKSWKMKSDFRVLSGGALPDLIAEPTNARSMSFVGTHEYLSPEIIRWKGHSSPVAGGHLASSFMSYFMGNPFQRPGPLGHSQRCSGPTVEVPRYASCEPRGSGLYSQPPGEETPKRIAYRWGATEIKQHPFFEGVNWALIGSTAPPHMPVLVDSRTSSVRKCPR